MTEDEILKVIQAYKDGKPIQVKNKSYDVWEDIEFPSWDFIANDYRIKPEFNYVQYDSVNEIDKSKWVHLKNTHVDRPILMIDRDRNQIAVLELNNWLDWYNPTDMFLRWEYEDGTPFGKKVSE